MVMRYNVVIGGQEISKTARGLVAYQPAIMAIDLVIGDGPTVAAVGAGSRSQSLRLD
jgi:hypothetical protein